MLLSLSLASLLQVVSPPEVSFQRECSAAEVRSLMRSTMDGADKKLDAMASRVAKHLGGGPLFATVWGALKQQLLARCARRLLPAACQQRCASFACACVAACCCCWCALCLTAAQRACASVT